MFNELILIKINYYIFIYIYLIKMNEIVIINSKEYKIKEELGKGSFGKVYLLQKDNKDYAYKKISISDSTKEEIEECYKEAKILSEFNNEYIVKFYFSCIDNNYFNILMEYAGKSNLKQFIKKYKDKNILIEENIIEDIIIQICLGLIEIHKNKIIHRDLTPDNIFINKDNKIKIGDFGVSKRLNTKGYAKTDTGKFHYNSPEREKGEKYDYKADIYSLGCIMYELFTTNEYFLDKFEGKNCKINNDIYNNKKWQEIIDLTLKIDYHERPSIEELYNEYIKKNKIILTVNVNKEDIKNKIYFFDNTDNHDNLKEMNKDNTELYINDEKYEYQKFFEPNKEGKYNIKIIFNFFMKDCKYMFFYCENIESIDLSSFNSRNVEYMNQMFYGCSNLKDIKLSSLNTKNVKDMSYMFRYCNNLKSIDLSSFNTEKVENMNFMFSNCKNLESINMSSFDTKNVNDMESMFSYCENIKEINISSFNIKNVKDISSMFRNCRNLQRIDLSSFVNDFENKTYNIFDGCDGLINIKLNKKLKEQIIKDNPNYKDNIFNNKNIEVNSDNCFIF